MFSLCLKPSILQLVQWCQVSRKEPLKLLQKAFSHIVTFFLLFDSWFCWLQQLIIWKWFRLDLKVTIENSHNFTVKCNQWHAVLMTRNAKITLSTNRAIYTIEITDRKQHLASQTQPSACLSNDWIYIHLMAIFQESEWVSSFLMAHQHIIGYSVP